MDFNGMRWAGNVYQKFEAMCLEVEEVMYEDTVKYMESQVQKVGVSVKKFYSEVMQDLLPPSSVDQEKVAAGDLFFNPYAHTDFSKKLKLSTPDNHKEFVDKKTNEDELIYDVTTEKKSFLRNHNDVNLHSEDPPRDLVQNKFSELYYVKSKKFGVHKHPIGIKRISQNHCPPKISRPVASLSGDNFNRLECDVGSACLIDSDFTNADSSIDFSMRPLLAEELSGNNTPPSTSCDSKKGGFGHTTLASDKISSIESVSKMKDDSEQVAFPSEELLSAEYLRQKKDDSVCASSGQGFQANSIGPSVKEDTCEDESVDEVIMLDEGTSMKNGPCFWLNSNIKSSISNDEASCKEVTMSCEDNFDMEVINNEEVAELGENSFKPVGRSEMDGSCVFVDENSLPSVPPRIHKNKSYKKKIREAISSKLRSTKKQDQLVTRHKDVPGNYDREDVPRDEIESQDHDSFNDSEWELL